MVYNTTYTPADTAGIVQDLVGGFFVGLIPWISAIIGIVLIIVLIKALKK
jgi:uncharacterized membrane protein